MNSDWAMRSSLRRSLVPVIFSPSPRRWLGIGKGQDNQRFAIQIDEDGATNIERNQAPKPHDLAGRELG